jgi:hypothetical protein
LRFPWSNILGYLISGIRVIPVIEHLGSGQ